MDIIKMLRSYAKRSDISAMDRSLMLEAADKLEEYQRREEAQAAMDVDLNTKLKEDRERAYNAMVEIGLDNEIWQDKTIAEMNKSIYDIIDKIERMERGARKCL